MVFKVFLGWSIHFSILLSAGVVLVYIYMGGLTSSIYNEVLQFFLIVLGFAPLTLLGLNHLGGWDGLKAKLDPGYLSMWRVMGDASQNPMGVHWIAMVMGLGVVLSFGYWCTDFLVVQRAMAAKDMNAAQMTPIIAAFPKALFPFLVILPGMIGIALMPDLKGHYDDALPRMLQQFYPSGLLGLGITALLASFMSGMAGNVTAFNTVFTYDIYQAHIRRNAPDEHYLWVGRWTTVVGIAISIGTAYIVLQFNNLMDYMQLLFSFFNAPLFGTFLLGMFWKRSTATGAFWGLLGGTITAMGHYFATKAGWISYPSDMTTNFYGAIYAFFACLALTWVISMVTAAPDEKDLVGLVYAVSPRPPSASLPWHRRPLTWGVVVLVFVAALNWWFW